MELYKVRKGDTLAGIAKQFQHRKWETIWNDPENKKLVSKRKKPEAIEPGDQLQIPPNEKQQAEAKAKEQEKSKEKFYTVTIKGRAYVLSEKEFDAFNKETLAELKKLVVAAEQRAVKARTCWDAFDELNRDQGFVSWCVGLRGPKLPPESLVTAAEQAHARLKSAVGSGDFKKISAEMKSCADPINTAYTTMMNYREAVIGRGEKQLAVLEFTRDTSFDIVSGIGTAVLGGTPASGAAAGGASAMLKSAAGELGQYLAGTSGGSAAAAKAIVLDGVIGAASGAVDALMKVRGDKIIEGVAERAAKKISGKWAGRLATKKVQGFLARRLEGALNAGLKSAVKNALKAMKGNETIGDFCHELEKDMGLGATLNGLDPWIEKNFAPAVYGKLVAAGLKLSGKATQQDAIDVISDLVKDKGEEGVEKALEIVMEKAKGDESAEDLGERAATEFARLNSKELKNEVVERLETNRRSAQ